MRRRYPMPLLSDPREFVTSVPLFVGYRADTDCTQARWGNLTDSAVRPLLQTNPFFQPAAAAYEAEIRQPAVAFSDDTMSALGVDAALTARKSRYFRMIVRLDAWGGAQRGLFGNLNEVIQTSLASPNIRLNNGLTQVNEVAMPIGTFRRLDAVLSVGAADTYLRVGSAIASGGTCIPRASSGASAGLVICGFSLQRPDITVAEAWMVNGRPTNRELAEWDQCDAARYGAGVLA